ncbi:hypothetical protein C8F04DRAFT_1178374 [Mycena alexandri]|uniref:Uncharacterized protein n=1 Tax=Mycena alexandri TaxID=1745969 RepID=A0AAD6T589_9AGAR|nr:hypothetical protein C8F04DRAFT_1178374 [Mycena alexandri]
MDSPDRQSWLNERPEVAEEFAQKPERAEENASVKPILRDCNGHARESLKSFDKPGWRSARLEERPTWAQEIALLGLKPGSLPRILASRDFDAGRWQRSGFVSLPNFRPSSRNWRKRSASASHDGRQPRGIVVILAVPGLVSKISGVPVDTHFDACKSQSGYDPPVLPLWRILSDPDWSAFNLLEDAIHAMFVCKHPPLLVIRAEFYQKFFGSYPELRGKYSDPGLFFKDILRTYAGDQPSLIYPPTISHAWTVESNIVSTILVAGEFKLDPEESGRVSHEVNNRQPACSCPSQAGDSACSLDFPPPFGSTTYYCPPLSQSDVIELVSPAVNEEQPLPGAMGRVPVELWAYVVRELLDVELEEDTTFLRYLDARETVRLVHSDLAAIVNGSPEFWTKMLINCSTPPDYIARHVACVRDRAMSVHIMLEPDLLYDLVWTQISLYCTADVFLLAALRILGPISAPNTDYLLFSCASCNYTDLSTPTACHRLLVNPPTLFNGDLPLLTKLRAVSSTVFGYLEIQDVPKIVWPSVDQFVSTLTASAALKELILWGGGVVIVPGVTLQLFTVSGLAVLSVFYTDSTKSVLTALAPGSYPALVELMCCDFDSVAWVETLNLSIFPNLTNLTICGGTDSPLHLATLFYHLHSLEILDISDAGPQYFSAMYNAPLLCPRLRHLTVGCEDVACLAGYVIMRSVESSYKPDAVVYWHDFVFPLGHFASILVSDLTSRLVEFTGYPPFP